MGGARARRRRPVGEPARTRPRALRRLPRGRRPGRPGGACFRTGAGRGSVSGQQPSRQKGIEGILRLAPVRSEENTAELQSLMRISYAVLRLSKTKTNIL